MDIVAVALLFLAIVAWISLRQSHKTPDHAEARQDERLYVDIESNTTGNKVRVYPYPGYKIDYVDADGVITTRPIYILAADRQHFDAYCFLRNDVRTFRIDRVLDMYAIGKGPIIDPAAEIGKYRRRAKDLHRDWSE